MGTGTNRGPGTGFHNDPSTDTETSPPLPFVDTNWEPASTVEDSKHPPENWPRSRLQVGMEPRLEKCSSPASTKTGGSSTDCGSTDFCARHPTNREAMSRDSHRCTSDFSEGRKIRFRYASSRSPARGAILLRFRPYDETVKAGRTPLGAMEFRRLRVVDIERLENTSIIVPILGTLGPLPAAPETECCGTTSTCVACTNCWDLLECVVQRPDGRPWLSSSRVFETAGRFRRAPSMTQMNRVGSGTWLAGKKNEHGTFPEDALVASTQ